METPEEVRSLIDQLGQALVQAIISDTAGQDLIKQIQQTGFEVGIMLEATVALHQKDKEEMEGQDEEFSDESMEIAEALARYFSRGPRPKGLDDTCESIRNFEWSEEDRAMLCNFRIRLD